MKPRTLDDVCALLVQVVERLDRIERALAGPAPGPAPRVSRKRGPKPRVVVPQEGPALDAWAEQMLLDAGFRPTKPRR